jgi:hypothetical protein
MLHVRLLTLLRYYPWQTMLAKLGYRLSLPTVWSFMKRFCKAAGRKVDEPDAFFHTISYLIELSMIQVCRPYESALEGIRAHQNIASFSD